MGVKKAVCQPPVIMLAEAPRAAKGGSLSRIHNYFHKDTLKHCLFQSGVVQNNWPEWLMLWGNGAKQGLRVGIWFRKLDTLQRQGLDQLWWEDMHIFVPMYCLSLCSHRVFELFIQVPRWPGEGAHCQTRHRPSWPPPHLAFHAMNVIWGPLTWDSSRFKHHGHS